MHLSASKILAVLLASVVVSGCVNSVTKQPDALVGSWKITDIKGQLINVETAALTFSEQGSVTGNNGCNNVMASYSPYGDHLNLTQLTTTKMICPGDQADAANAFMKNIPVVEHFLVDGQKLYLTDEQDKVVIGLSK